MKSIMIGAVAAVVFAAPAHADPVTDSWEATYKALGATLNGTPAHDAAVLVGVDHGIADDYGLRPADAAWVIDEQVKLYCPQYLPNLQAIAERGVG